MIEIHNTSNRVIGTGDMMIEPTVTVVELTDTLMETIATVTEMTIVMIGTIVTITDAINTVGETRSLK